MKLKKVRLLAAFAGLFACSMASTAMAGTFIIAGTDADDHGFVDGFGNQDGWLFMQKSLESIAPGVTNGNKVVTVLGSSSTALSAASSSFNLSSLVGAGWTLQIVDGATNLTDFFSNSGAFAATGIASSGILMMDSGSSNVFGGADNSELGVFTSNATTINSFLGGGGGLFSQANGYGWISALLPTLGIVNESDQGLGLTAAGTAAFPGLTNADLSSGPWHNSFTNTGTLPILATSTSSFTLDHAVILGASGGSVTNPTPPGVPDGGSSLILMFGSIGSLAAGRRFMKSRRSVA